MRDVSRIYEGIAKLVLQIAPEEARVVIYTFIVQAEATEEEGGVYRHEFDYVNQNDELNWFGTGAIAVTGLLTSLALELRSDLEEKTEDKWKSMKFYINMEKRNFKAELSY
jgi:hypothetical protein